MNKKVLLIEDDAYVYEQRHFACYRNALPVENDAMYIEDDAMYISKNVLHINKPSTFFAE